MHIFDAMPNVALGHTMNSQRVMDCAFAPLPIVTVQALCDLQAGVQLSTTVLSLDLPTQIRMMLFLAHQNAVHHDCLSQGISFDVHIGAKSGSRRMRNHVFYIGAPAVGRILIGKDGVQALFEKRYRRARGGGQSRP